ncbi:hypothetical protein Cob_v008755 [Colletotrichum orbiculare MAFF 240422]|uniref:NAD(P)-binding domain-containing protein n=1 Tax=Colletotrichum orbiculare (strain 104-T / ATCC 96160 / CBS 514.97 / LARS 414 / MAFF 240422) TaxID=1213857 RepID=A0A484FMY6_COLOR|nr:hypothetical protein Cob_v008755 [Colletotrichum orbiculare MAFF 240422]
MDVSSEHSAGQATTDGKTKLKPQLPVSCDPPYPDAPQKQLVWVVFGGTGHMGRSLVKCALSRGDLVACVGRVFETRPDELSAWQDHENYLGLLALPTH